MSQELGNLQVTPLFMGIEPSEVGGALEIEGTSGTFILPAQRTSPGTVGEEEGEGTTE